MKKYIIMSIAAMAVATTGTYAQSEQLPADNYSITEQRYATPSASYNVPDGIYLRGYDNPLLGTMPTGPVEIVVPPYSAVRFTDTSSNIPGSLSAQWSINNSEAYPEGSDDYGLPSGDATIVEADADGSYLYNIGEEGMYRYPIITYGRYNYDFSDENSTLGLDGNYYTRAGILATNDDVSITMHPVGGDNYYNRFVSFLFGGCDLVTVYPTATTDTEAGEGTFIETVCDGNEATYYTTDDAPAVGDVIIVDCGEVAARNGITLAFANADHILVGDASILVGTTDKVDEMTEVGTYSSTALAEGATTYSCSAGGIEARYIAVKVTAVADDSVQPYYAEISEDGMRQFTGPVYEINSATFPVASTSLSTYQSNSIDRILDDNASTYFWSSASQSVGAYVMVDYGMVAPRNTIKLVLTSNDYPRHFVVEISTDGSEWTQIGDEQDFSSAAPSDNTLYFDAAGAEARYVRMRITGAVSNWMQVADLIVDDINQTYELSDTTVMESQHPVVKNVFTHFPKPAGTFVLDHLTMFVTGTPSNPGNLVLPATEGIKVSISGDNLIEVINEATVTLNDMRPVGTYGGKTVYAIDVYFRDEVILNDDFFVSVNDLDKITGLNISFMFGYNRFERSGDYGRAMYTDTDGVISHRGDYAFMWQLHGHYVSLCPIEASEVLVADPKGGTVITDFIYTTSSISEINVGADEWLHFDFITTQLGRIAAYSIVADANDTNETREGKIWLNAADGAYYTFTVTQERDETPTGIHELSAKQVNVARMGDNFIVTYPETIDHIAMYSATGTKVIDSKLPAAGSHVIPTDNLAPGLYIVKFTGTAGTVTVKVIK